MILLEYNNRILFDVISSRLEAPDKAEACDITLVDFDGVQFHVSTPDPNQKNLLQVSIQWRCINELMQHGAGAALKDYYGPFVQSSPEQGYDVTLRIDLNNVPGDKSKLAERVSLLKRHLLAAPFKKVFAAVEAGSASGEVIAINYREDEAFYIKGDQDRVFVIFSIAFRDPGDQVLAKVFLGEFADVRKTLSNAPSVSYSQKDAPGELQGVRGVKVGENHGFVSFVLFKNHISKQNADKIINNVQTFRNYLHYHIKCSKAHLHTRMRNRVDGWLQILNRARPTDSIEKKEKKLASGRTFVRK